MENKRFDLLNKKIVWKIDKMYSTFVNVPGNQDRRLRDSLYVRTIVDRTLEKVNCV